MAPKPPKIRPYPKKSEPVRPPAKEKTIDSYKPASPSSERKPMSRNNRPPRPAGFLRMPHMPTKSLSDRKFFAKEGSLTGHELLETGGTNGKMEKDTVYFVPLGGLEEVGRNCSFFEYNDEIVIIDMAFNFRKRKRRVLTG